MLPATAFGPIPPQPPAPFPGMPVWTPGDGDDIVDVWRPSLRDTHLPVLVWIYGGSYTGGGRADGAGVGRFRGHGRILDGRP
ncbi:para-nitrobenzyl esterase [Kutzneria buriramensis]|uniref:Para-nitrobenzyl esterase n=1 Tax=Kutzneria buriramensis TaxID=1045776 RepID=A0A3E0H3E3_9PSEU|nr:para-nitrobenzyl esterase [Kutzneria buriramensis]